MLKALLCSVVFVAVLLPLLPYLVLYCKELARDFWHNWMEAWREAFTGWKNKDKEDMK